MKLHIFCNYSPQHGLLGKNNHILDTFLPTTKIDDLFCPIFPFFKTYPGLLVGKSSTRFFKKMYMMSKTFFLIMWFGDTLDMRCYHKLARKAIPGKMTGGNVPMDVLIKGTN